MSSGRRKPKKAKGDHQGRAHLDHMVLVVFGRVAGSHEQWPKTLTGKPISDFRQPSGLLKG
jgi:hypothetical protein